MHCVARLKVEWNRVVLIRIGNHNHPFCVAEQTINVSCCGCCFKGMFEWAVTSLFRLIMIGDLHAQN